MMRIFNFDSTPMERVRTQHRYRRLFICFLQISLVVGIGLDIRLDKGGIESTTSLLVPSAQASSVVYPFSTDVLSARREPYISKLETVANYYAVQGAWQQSPESDVALWIRNNQNQAWLSLEGDPDAELGVSQPVLLERSSYIQVKVLVRKGSIDHLQLNVLDPGAPASGSLPQAQADEVVITRAKWGADESLRLRETRDRIRADAAKKAPTPKPTDTKTSPPASAPATTDSKQSDASEYGPNCSILESKYPNEFKVGQVLSTDVAGKEFTWPIAYTMKLRKIVVHHTDMEIKDYDQNGTIDSTDYIAGIRSIYYFHAISRDWGDIGYNYLIDPAGHIYEGRAGGDMAIAAHTLCKNNGSLGVALLGNFKDQSPTPEALQALQSLVDAKAKAYNIDPKGMSMFYGSLIPNIVGHRNVRSTDCPGDKLYDLLPQLRSGSLATKETIVFPVVDPSIYRKSVPVPNVVPETQKIYRSQAQSVVASVLAEPSKAIHPTLTFQNLGTTIWNQDTVIRPVFLEKGATLLKQIRQQQDFVSPNGLATFSPELVFDHQLSGRAFTIEFYVVINDQVELTMERAKLNVQVIDQAKADVTLNGVPLNQLKTTLTQNAIAAQLLRSSSHVTQFLTEEIGGPSVSSTTTDRKDIRIKLQAPDNASIAEASSDANLVIDNRTVATVVEGNRIVIAPQSQGLVVKAGKSIYEGTVVRLVPLGTDGKISLVNVSHVPEWNQNLNDNVYRNVIEWRILSGKLVTINELPLEYYLRGLAEVSNTAHPEKQKVMAIIARSYAQYYLTKDKKFPGMPYDLDDDPNSSQKYLGYGYESRSPNFLHAVESTAGQVVTYQGEVVKTPYFNKSDGRTRSAQEVWGWTNTPYLPSLPDPLCTSDDRKLSGHGVGLSGCGADGAAARGYTAEQILHYYYPGTIISTL